MMEEDEAKSKKEFVYDFFIDENPYVKERIEKAVAQRIAQGLVEVMQTLIQVAIEECFPALADLAQPQIEQIQDANVLKTLCLQLISTSTENEARNLLHI